MSRFPEAEYALQTPDYEKWFSGLNPGSASLQHAFAAGDAHGADTQRSRIFGMLPDLVVEAEGDADGETIRRYAADLAAHSGPFGRLVP